MINDFLDECLQEALNNKAYNKMKLILDVIDSMKYIRESKSREPTPLELFEAALYQYKPFDDISSKIIDHFKIDCTAPAMLEQLERAIYNCCKETALKLISNGCPVAHTIMMKCASTSLEKDSVIEILGALKANHPELFDDDNSMLAAIRYTELAEKYEVGEYLVQSTANITPDIFLIIAKFGDIERIKQLIDQGIDPNYTDDEGLNVMKIAIETDNLELFKLLQEYYAVKVPEDALDIALSKNALKCGDYLLYSGFSLGHDAWNSVFNGHYDRPAFTKMLLEYGQGPEDTTSIAFSAARKGEDELASLCLLLGAQTYHQKSSYSRKWGNRSTTENLYKIIENQDMPLTSKILAEMHADQEEEMRATVENREPVGHWKERVEEQYANRVASTGKDSLLWKAAKKLPKDQKTGIPDLDKVARTAQRFNKPKKKPRT